MLWQDKDKVFLVSMDDVYDKIYKKYNFFMQGLKSWSITSARFKFNRGDYYHETVT